MLMSGAAMTASRIQRTHQRTSTTSSSQLPTIAATSVAAMLTIPGRASRLRDTMNSDASEDTT